MQHARINARKLPLPSFMRLPRLDAPCQVRTRSRKQYSASDLKTLSQPTALHKTAERPHGRARDHGPSRDSSSVSGPTGSALPGWIGSTHRTSSGGSSAACSCQAGPPSRHGRRDVSNRGRSQAGRGSHHTPACRLRSVRAVSGIQLAQRRTRLPRAGCHRRALVPSAYRGEPPASTPVKRLCGPSGRGMYLVTAYQSLC